MATKTFGTHEVKRLDTAELTAEIWKLAGVKFPISTTIVDNKLVGVTFETTWQEGTTSPVENEDGTIENVGDYTTRKLTAKQIETVEDWIESKLRQP